MSRAGRPRVVADGVSKWYRLRDQRPTMAAALRRATIGRGAGSPLVWSLRGVTFEVAEGESLGIVGPNGAGKTTLLKVIAGIARPSAGRLEVWGRVSAQLALTSGFHQYLTGRENLFLQGTILGLTNHEVARLVPRLVAFAELDAVIDRPIWTYSSGMVARLGFAIAVHARFDLLLLDEALGAGDVSFRDRCRAALDALRRDGKTLIIVSHGAQSIQQLCDRALWLHEGQIRAIGEPGDVVGRYEGAVRASESAARPGSVA
jgi:ABC-type polysaccharide/polyol phosphate transport system ATPase subunit